MKASDASDKSLLIHDRKHNIDWHFCSSRIVLSLFLVLFLFGFIFDEKYLDKSMYWLRTDETPLLQNFH